MGHEHKCPECGKMVAPTPFIGAIGEEQDSLQRKFVCDCETLFYREISLGQKSLTDFDTDATDVVPSTSENSSQNHFD